MNFKLKTTRKQAIFKKTALLSALALLLLATPSSTFATITVNAAGATFPYPFIKTVIGNFSAVNPGYGVNYQSIGSGAGINDLIGKSVDFAASDAPLNDAQRTSAPNSLHIPETIGSITLSYNLPSVALRVNLTGPIIADIFRGVITKWNNATIQSINPGISLPNQSITVVHRSDGSGTTFVFTSYLSVVSPAWASTVGNSTTVAWPVGVGQQGNAGVAQYVLTTPYAIGYVELNYALTNGLTFAKVSNPMGQYVTANLTSTQSAVNAYSASLPTGSQSWYHVRMLNINAPYAYPIASFSYFLVYKELNVTTGITAQLANLVVAYLWYHVHTGQNFANGLNYVKLPSTVITIDENTINSVTYNGLPVSNTLPSLTPTLTGVLPIALLGLSLAAAVTISRRRQLAK